MLQLAYGLIFGVIFLAIDATWLRATNALYKKELGHLLRAQPNFIAAGLFYLIYIAGALVFALLPSLQSASWVQAASLGALFGVVTYATYDLTNLAAIKNWSSKLAVIDIVWGAFASAVAITITFFIIQAWL